jgi:hypothetical protein
MHVQRSSLVAAIALAVPVAASCDDDADATATATATSTSSSSAQVGSGGATASSTASSATTGGNGGAGGSEAAAFTFFVTSQGSGALGGNLGGLAGADTMCQALAGTAGLGNATWRAYLSTGDENARDRIGSGPWFNFDGEMIAADVDALHADGLSNGMPQHALDEYGNVVPSSEHDILTGSIDDGTIAQGSTCNDWTSDAGGDSARVGHSDIPSNPSFSPSWNNAHDSAGCSQANLEQTGGSGRLYCFAL